MALLYKLINSCIISEVGSDYSNFSCDPILFMISSIFRDLIAFEDTSASYILRFFSYILFSDAPRFFTPITSLFNSSWAFGIIKFNIHWSFSSTFLQMNCTLSGLSIFLLTYSNAGKLAWAISLATFLILWSGSRSKNCDSVSTINTSTRVFFNCDLSMLLFSYYELSFSSLQWKNVHYGLPVHMLVSYYSPRWNLPSTTGPPVWGSTS